MKNTESGCETILSWWGNKSNAFARRTLPSVMGIVVFLILAGFCGRESNAQIASVSRSLAGDSTLSETQCLRVDSTLRQPCKDFTRPSLGFRLGYSELYSTYFGLSLSSDFANDSRWDALFSLDIHSSDKGYREWVVKANVGRGLVSDRGFNIRGFVGVGDWIVASTSHSSSPSRFPVFSLGLTAEIKPVPHVILGATIEQQFWLPYAFLAASPALMLTSRFHL